MAEIVMVGAGPVGIRQHINAGHNFDGTAPAGTPTTSPGLVEYPAADAGGLFQWSNPGPAGTVYPAIRVLRMSFDFGGNVDWVLNLVEDGEPDIMVADQTSNPEYLDLDLNFVLLSGQALELTTVGGANAMVATITAVRAEAGM